MLKPQVAGEHSIRVYARLNKSLAVSLSKKKKLAQQGPGQIVSDDFTVRVVNGVETLDSLGLFVSKKGALAVAGSGTPRLSLKLGEPIEIRVVGIKHRLAWSGQNKAYEINGRLIVTLKDVCWMFEPNGIGEFAGEAILEVLESNASHVRVTGVRAGKDNVNGWLAIHAYGRVWRLEMDIA